MLTSAMMPNAYKSRLSRIDSFGARKSAAVPHPGRNEPCWCGFKKCYDRQPCVDHPFPPALCIGWRISRSPSSRVRRRSQPGKTSHPSREMNGLAGSPRPRSRRPALDTSREPARTSRKESAVLVGGPAARITEPRASIGIACALYAPVSQDTTCDSFRWQMINLRDAIRAELERERRRQELLQVGRGLRLAWTLGKTTLYKYMSFADQERRDRVLDVMRNSRV
jgi:hypothetical protein